MKAGAGRVGHAGRIRGRARDHSARPVRMILPSLAGGGTDFVGRII